MSHVKDRPRLYVLGLGSIGIFTTHFLPEIPQRPFITLLLHRDSLLDEYHNNKNQITLETMEGKVKEASGYDVEILRERKWYHHQGLSARSAFSMIHHLIISVKATQTVSALRPLKHRLAAESTILFLQNGWGAIDDVNRCIFPDPRARPNYIVGVVSHGVMLSRPFHAIHTGCGAISLGPVPRSAEIDSTLPPSGQYMLHNLPLSPHLNATSYPWSETLHIQLEKLAFNAFWNPICALNDAKNGFLFTSPATRRELLLEISNVVLNMPELKDIPGLQIRFPVNRLEAMVDGILNRSVETTCSMAWDLRAGRETEVKYISGYWVKRGKEVGVPTPINEILMTRVMNKSDQGI